MANKPELTYWHVYTDENGVSRQEKAILSGFKQESMGGDADPQWNDHIFRGEVEILFAVHPVGWQGDWHENPRPQWIIPLSGRWFVETMDGKRVEMSPGELSFGADQNTVEDDEGRKGHVSGVVGDEPAHLMVVQLKDDAFIGAKLGVFE